MPRVVEPSATPPEPPSWLGIGDGDGEEPGRLPWWLWVLGLVLVGAWLVGTYSLLPSIAWRPFPVLAALAAAVATAWATYEPSEQRAERFQLWVIATGICGGVVGELVHYLVLGVPPSVPAGAFWLFVGAGGIGGGIGVATGCYVSLSWPIGALVWLIWRMWRRRAA